MPGTMSGGQPYLSVASRANRTAGDVTITPTGWLWVPWPECIAPAGDTQAAACAIAALLADAAAQP